jgi:replicative DNA helicase
MAIVDPKPTRRSAPGTPRGQKLPDDAAERVKEATDILALVQSDGIVLKREGHDWKGLCPFHNEKSPSFSVVPEKGIFHCFGCGKGGDAVAWMTEKRGMGFVEAVRALAAMAGISLDAPGATSAGGVTRRSGPKVGAIGGGASEPAKPKGPRRPTPFDFKPTLDQDCHADLLFGCADGDVVREYLMNDRKISMEAIQHFRLGVLVLRRPDGTTRARFLSIPCYDRKGVLLTVRFRTIPGPCLDCPGDNADCRSCKGRGQGVLKAYLHCPDRPLPLFNVASLTSDTSATVLVTEGELDVVAAWVYGIRDNVVTGTGGSDKFDESWYDALEPYRGFSLCQDGDGPGDKAADREAKRLGLYRCSRVVLPKKDLGDCLQGGVPISEVQVALRNARPMVATKFALASSFRQKIEDRIARPALLVGLPTGSSKLDRILGGWRPGLVVVTGGTGCLTGDTLVGINRGGKGGRVRLDHVFRMQNGGMAGGRRWDLAIPTRVQCSVDGLGRLATLGAAVDSGVKEILTLRGGGNEIRGSVDHPFLTPDGWVRLGDLRPGDRVYQMARPAGGARNPKHHYRMTSVRNHPFANYIETLEARYGDRANEPKHVRRVWRVPDHRLVAEAGVNGLSVDAFVARVRSGAVAGLTFLDPEVYAVHHIDRNHLNNQPGNLEVLTHEEHRRLHGTEHNLGNVLWRNRECIVDSVERTGEEQTYDLMLAEEPHNFTANGFVVHNSGKTSFTAWASREQALRGVPSLVTCFEQSPEQLAEKYLRMEVGGDFTKVDVGMRDLAWSRLDSMAAPIHFVDHYGRMGKEELFEAIRYAVRRFDVRWVMIDHAGYVKLDRGEESAAEVDEFMIDLAVLGKNEECCLVTVCHPNRMYVAQGRSRPGMSDLKGGSGIEQNAQAVLVVVRNDVSKTNTTPSTDLCLDKVRSEFGMPGSSCRLAYDPLATTYADDWIQTPMGRAGRGGAVITPTGPPTAAPTQRSKPEREEVPTGADGVPV